MLKIRDRVLRLNDEDLVDFASSFVTEFKLIMLDLYDTVDRPMLESVIEYLEYLESTNEREVEIMDKRIAKAIDIKEARDNIGIYQKKLDYYRARTKARVKAYNESGLKCGINNFSFRFTQKDFENYKITN